MSQQIQPSGQPEQRQAGPSIGQVFPTRSYLSENVRRGSIEMLNQLLADTTVLRTQAKYAHWNVKGMNFFQLHELFDELAEVLADHEDDIAERVTALGGQATGTVRLAADSARIPDVPTTVTTGPEFLEVLTERLAIHDANLYECINAAVDRQDPDTADLLNEVSREVTKYRWFLEAHINTQPLAGGQQGSTGWTSGGGSWMGGPLGDQTRPSGGSPPVGGQFGSGSQQF